MNAPLKVMILEDHKPDQVLVKRQVLKYQQQSIFTIADCKEAFLQKIHWFLPDLILADYNLPDYTGLDALMYVKENKPFIPFIFVTGGLVITDPIAKVVLNLADDFIMKDDLPSLHIKIKQAMMRMADKINEQQAINQNINEQRLELLKATALLKDSGDSEERDKLIDLSKSFRDKHQK